MVVPGKTGRMKTAVQQALTMPEMVIAPSVLPALQGRKDAWGVFAPNDIQKGTLVAVYGGIVTERTRAEELFWGRHGSHLKSMRGKWTGWTLDGRVCDKTPLSYYVDNGLVGSIINNFQGSGQSPNVDEVDIEGVSFQHPYDVRACLDTILM